MSQTLNKKLFWGYYAFALFWLIGTLWLGSYFIEQKVRYFDPNDTLANISSEQITSSFQDVLYKGAENQLENSEKGIKTALHFITPGCDCNVVVEAHKLELNKELKALGFESIDIVIDASLDKTNPVVPSTPAIALLDDNNELIYFGPYSAGYVCSSNNSFVELAVNNFIRGFNPKLIKSEVAGCYCNQPFKESKRV